MKHVKLLFNTILWLGALSVANAQSNRADSLETVLASSTIDSLKIKVINLLMYEYLDVNTKRCAELAELSLELVDRTENLHDKGNTYLNYALIKESFGEYTQSLEYNFKALPFFQMLHDSIGIGNLYNNIGIAYNQMGDYSMAAYYLLRSIETNRNHADEIRNAGGYINLSEVYYCAKNYDAAISWGHKALTLTQKYNDETLMGYACETLAIPYIDQNLLDSARVLIDISSTIGRKQNNEYLINRNTGHLGRLFLKLKQYDSAEYYLLKVIELSKGKNQSDILLPGLIALSKCYLQLGRPTKAMKYAQESYAISLAIKNNPQAMESCTLMANISEKRHKLEDVIRYLRLASSFKDTILVQSMKGSIQAKAFDLNLENEKRAREIATLDLAQKDKVLIRQRFMLALGTVILLSLLMVMYLIRKASTERKKTNEQLIKNNIELNKLNQEVNGLINTIVHDLKAPLNSLQGILYLLEQEVPNNENTRDLIKHGFKSIDSGHEIIKELLELRELEEKATVLQLQSTDLKELLNSVRSEHLPYAQQKQIDLNADAEASKVEIDPQLVKRLLNNLVSNAIKYSPQGKPVQMRAWKNSHVVYFEVADSGQGFHEKDLDKIYQKFQKLSARPTAGESSHGLGLATVNLLVQRMNASIDLKTEWGKGSTFLVTVPVA